MSKMLNLAEQLLGLGRTHQQLGRIHDAFSILSRLSRFRELPRAVAEETQARLGEIQLQRKKFSRAYRHLLAALRHDPDNARYHHLLGNALREQGEDQWERAAGHFRRALERDSQQVESLIELGLLCVRAGKADEGVAHLHRAAELKPDDAEVLGKLVKGLRWAGRLNDARSALRAGLFRNPRDCRFHQLWSDFQFRIRRRQQKCQEIRNRSGRQPGPVLLPFVRVTAAAEPRCVTAKTSTLAPVPVPRTLRGVGPLEQRNVL